MARQDHGALLNSLAASLARHVGLDREVAARVSEVVQGFLGADLDDARAYRELRQRIVSSMADPGCWNDGGSAMANLAGYVEFMAANATYGDCESCREPIPAAQRPREVGRTGGWEAYPIYVCQGCR